MSRKEAHLRADPDGPVVVSQFKIPEGGEGLSWTHPVIRDGRLYVRHSDKLFAYDVRDRQ